MIEEKFKCFIDTLEKVTKRLESHSKCIDKAETCISIAEDLTTKLQGNLSVWQKKLTAA